MHATERFARDNGLSLIVAKRLLRARRDWTVGHEQPASRINCKPITPVAAPHKRSARPVASLSTFNEAPRFAG
jgi:hypothetical protein